MGPMGAEEVDRDRSVTSQGWTSGSGERGSRAAGSSVSSTWPWAARHEEVCLRRRPQQARRAPPGGPPSLPTATSWRPRHRPALRNPQGPGPRGDAPSKRSLLREERPSRGAPEPPVVGECSQPGGPHTRPKLRMNECAWGRAGLPCRHRRLTLPGTEVRPRWSPSLWGGGWGGPTRGASCLELRRHWTGAVLGAPWCRDPPRRATGARARCSGLGCPRGGDPPGGSGQRALGGHWGAKGGLGEPGDGRVGASETIIRDRMALPPSPSSTLEFRPCWNILGPAGCPWGPGTGGGGGQIMLLLRAWSRNRPPDPAGKRGGVKDLLERQAAFRQLGSEPACLDQWPPKVRVLCTGHPGVSGTPPPREAAHHTCAGLRGGCTPPCRTRLPESR